MVALLKVLPNMLNNGAFRVHTVLDDIDTGGNDLTDIVREVGGLDHGGILFAGPVIHYR